MIRSAGRLLSLAMMIAPLMALGADQMNPIDVPQPDRFPDELVAIVEIPRGSNIKYEIDEDSGQVFVDRFISMPVAYPANYGCFPSTMGGDNDPLDVLVFTREPVAPGCLIRVRPIGVLKSSDMEDNGEMVPDDKILVVPTSKIDPTYDEIKTIDDLPRLDRQRLEAFFRVYKQLPRNGKKMELHGFGGIDEAQTMLKEAAKRYQESDRAKESASSH